MESGTDVRQSAVAGIFYPDDRNELSQVIDGFFSNAKLLPNRQKLRALIIPHAGYIYSGQTAAWGYKQLQDSKYKHFVLTGPSHHSYFDGLSSSSAKEWSTPIGLTKHNIISEETNRVKVFDEAHSREHSLEVQLPFLQKIVRNLSVTCFLTGFNVDVESAADYFIDNYPNSFLIVSSDLSHFLTQDEASEKDRQTIEAILKMNKQYLHSHENVACGLTGILILLEIVKKRRWQAKLLYYDTSYTASGDKNNVVGYTTIGFYK